MLAVVVCLIVALASGFATEGLRGQESISIALVLVAAAVGVVVTALWGRCRSNGRFLLEPPVVVLLIFFFWHFSFWVVVFAGMASDYRLQEYFQLAPTSTLAALSACVSGLASTATGLLMSLGKSRSFGAIRMHRGAPKGLRLLIAVSCLLVVAYFAVRGHSLVGRYDAVYLESDPIRRLYNLGVLILLACLGPLTVTEQLRPRLVIGFGTAVMTVLIVAALMGSRWIIFSATIMIVVALNLRGVRLPKIRLGILAVVLVLGGTYVKDFRSSPRNAAQPVLLGRGTNPLVEFLEEMGQAFASVTATLELYQSPADYRHGSTMAQAALSIIPSAAQLYGRAELRPSHEIAERFFTEKYIDEGFTIGFSIVAEFYLNFGIGGVLVGCWLLGIVMGGIYRKFLRSVDVSWLFVELSLLSFLLFGLRNDFQTWLRFAAWTVVPIALFGRQVRGSIDFVMGPRSEAGDLPAHGRFISSHDYYRVTSAARH